MGGAERGKLALTRRGTRQILMSLFDDPTHEPTKEGLDRIMNAIDEDAESDEDIDGGTRRRLTACAKKYRAYLEHQSLLVDSLFVSFDADQSGTLQRDELLSLLRSNRREESRPDARATRHGPNAVLQDRCHARRGRDTIWRRRSPRCETRVRADDDVASCSCQRRSLRSVVTCVCVARGPRKGKDEQIGRASGCPCPSVLVS